LARQHDLTQNSPLETPFLSLLCCRYVYEEVLMNSIQLACRSKYVIWQACRTELKNTSLNTIQEYYGACVVLSCLLVFLMHFLILFSMLSSIKTLQKHSLVHFGLYNNLIFFCQIWIILFEYTQFFWTLAFHQRFGRLVECSMHFWTVGRWNTFYFTVVMIYDSF
jgi:hypothetical protein